MSEKPTVEFEPIQGIPIERLVDCYLACKGIAHPKEIPELIEVVKKAAEWNATLDEALKALGLEDEG